MLFVIAGALSALSPSIGLLIGLQAVQGIGAGLMIPQSLALINACFPENERGRAIGLWAGMSGAISTLGPWVGGWLVQSLSWRAVFFMNVPLCIAVIILSTIYVPKTQTLSGHRLDWKGTCLVFIGLLGLAYGLMSGPSDGWSNTLIISSLTVGAVALAGFVLVESRVDDPLVPFLIFKIPLVAGANLATLFLYFALNGSVFFMVLNFQQVQGYSPLFSGLGLLPSIVLITFLSGPAGTLADRIGPRLQMILGPFVVACGMAWLMTADVNANYFKTFLPGLALFGLGMSMVIAPLTKSALSVQPELSGVASGVNNAVARVAALLAVALLGAIILSVFQSHLGSTIGSSALSPDQQRQILEQSTKLGAIVVPTDFDAAARQTSLAAVKESFVYGFRWIMALNALLALAAATISAFTIHNPERARFSRLISG
jgi:EmrB/QacA subfamily drug resistance transporter